MNVIDLAGRAGFGGQLRNTHKVKLELFAQMVWNDAIEEAKMELLRLQDQVGDVHNYYHCAANDIEDLKK